MAGRGRAARMACLSTGRNGKRRTSDDSLYRAVHTGGSADRSKICRSLPMLVRNLMNASAVAGCGANELIARFAPPRVLDPGPANPGRVVTPNRPATLFPGVRWLAWP